MKAIGKKAIDEQEALVTRLRETYSAVEDALQAFNHLVETAWEEVTNAIATHNEVIAEAKSWADDQIVDMEAYHDERSEQWQESAAGRTYKEWMYTYQNVELEEIDLEQPDAIELETGDPSDELEMLEAAPE